MNLRTILGAAAIIASAVSGRAFGQASINENESTYIYVNGSSGSDSHPGTSSEPVKTIQQGVDLAVSHVRAGTGVKVLIAPGTYRESVQVPSVNSNAALTIQAETTGSVAIDGADLLSNASSMGNGVYAYYWHDSVSGCSLPSGWIPGMPPVVLANEMVFVNGTPMTQVMSSSQLVPGTFYVNIADERIEIDPLSGTDIYSSQVAVSSRRTTLTIDNSRNIVIRGLALQHAASCMNTGGAGVYSSSNILFDRVTANWNNWGAMGINTSSDVTVQNSVASYNGGLGFMGYEIQHGLFSNNEADYNAWRAEMAALYDFAQGGFKFGATRSITVNGQRSYNNQGEGLWFDTDNATVTVENSVLVGNTNENLKFEANQGPFTVTGNTLCNGGVGVILMDSAGVTMTGNFIYGNQSTGMNATYGNLATSQNGQVFLAGASGGRTFTNFQTGATVNTQNTHITLNDNTFVDSGSGQYLFNTYLSGYAWTDFLDTFHSNGNKWWDPSNHDSIRSPGGHTVSLSGWRSLTAQDGTSEWVSVPAAEACHAPSPAHADFAVTARNAVNYINSYTMSSGKLSIPLQVKSFSFGGVNLSVKGLPAGVGASFSASSLVSGSSVLNLTASSSAKSQKVPITIFATSSTRVHTITLYVNVRPA